MNGCSKSFFLAPCLALLIPAMAGADSPPQFTRPEGMKLFDGIPRNELVSLGEKLFNDPSLGTSGLACTSCHATDDNFGPSFATPYPHAVASTAGQTVHDQVHADEIIQFCVQVPLKGRPLPWDSQELAALTAYILDIRQPAFMAKQSQ